MIPPASALGRAGLIAGLLYAGPALAQGPIVVPVSAVAPTMRPLVRVPTEALDPAFRERVLKVMHQPTLSARAAPEDLPLGIYTWLLDHPDRASLAWRRLGIPCAEITLRGDGTYGWSDGQGTEVGWRTVANMDDVRVWYAEGHTRLGPLLPMVPVRAVAVLHHVRQMGADGRSVITHHTDVYVQTDSKAAAAVARLVGPTAPRLAEQGAAQLLLFFSGLTRYFEQHPEDIGILLAEKRPN